ncbi:MAG: cytochrome c [Gammaproteobacteria bacterium]|nr:cytochrome c [Gammaproteobacteria bacterium]
MATQRFPVAGLYIGRYCHSAAAPGNSTAHFESAATDSERGEVEQGRLLFVDNCAMCHETNFGNRGLFPDLRYSAMLNTQAAFDSVVLQGVRQANGMRSFEGTLNASDTGVIRAYLIDARTSGCDALNAVICGDDRSAVRSTGATGFKCIWRCDNRYRQRPAIADDQQRWYRFAPYPRTCNGCAHR